MTTRIGHHVERIFSTAWNKMGRPQIKIIRPVSEWHLPDGYTYDESVDVLRDENDAVVSDSMRYAVGDIIPVMSGGIEFTMRGQQDQNVAMTAAGLTANNIVVMRTMPRYESIIRAGFAAEVDGELYNINGVNVVPEGAKPPLWINITLKSR